MAEFTARTGRIKTAVHCIVPGTVRTSEKLLLKIDVQSLLLYILHGN